ncbi:hypothetical protein FRC01_008841 [Tulasnella sp. 417]|nr:hypothetical protein FRC01_008841 [Tulasnella sp. 417]
MNSHHVFGQSDTVSFRHLPFCHVLQVIEGCERIDNHKVELNARSGYSVMGYSTQNKYDWASEYYWEWAQTPKASNTPPPQDEATTFLKASNILLSCTVTDINYSDSGVSVKLESGDELKAKYALVTFSVGMLQHPEDVKFEPALPQWKTEAIYTMKMGTYIKSDESERIGNLSDEEVIDEVRGVLKNMYPGKKIPRPKHMHFNRWYNDKLTRGAFSNWPASFYVKHQDNLRAPVQTLYFAGEHTSFEFSGYIQGAYLEGDNASKAIANRDGGEFQNKNEYFPQWYKVQEVHK